MKDALLNKGDRKKETESNMYGTEKIEKKGKNKK